MSTDSISPPGTLAGRCYCGKCQYEVDIDGSFPKHSVYCHCDSCRRAHSTSLYHISALPADKFRFTSGEDLITHHTREGSKIDRAFCKECGTHMVNYFGNIPSMGGVMVGFFPNTLDAQDQEKSKDYLAAQKHYHSIEACMALESYNDDLPRLEFDAKPLVPPEKDDSIASGYCYCGSIKFEVEISEENAHKLYCHCESCRRAHAAPIYHIIYVPKERFRIVDGEEYLQRFKRKPNVVDRSFCTKCGSRVVNYSSKGIDIGYFPSLLEPEAQKRLNEFHIPTEHHLSEETVLKLDLWDDGIQRG